MAKRSVTLFVCLSSIWFACGSPSNPGPTQSNLNVAEVQAPILLPTGALITPLAADGSTAQVLNPQLPTRPDFIAGEAVTTAVSPDGMTMLVLTSGYNRNYGDNGQFIPSESNEYVFVFDISSEQPVQQQVLQVPNTFDGIAWSPSGDQFVVSGGKDDNIHVFDRSTGQWAESFTVSLRHGSGLGLGVGPQSAGVAFTQNGNWVVVANFENDTVSIVDLGLRAVSEVELRPGKIDPSQSGVRGGEFPFWVAVLRNDKAYVSSMRDREIVVIDLRAQPPQVVHRIGVSGQPNRMIFNGAGTRLFVANGSSDSVSIIDTATEQVIDEIRTTAPARFYATIGGFKGANPNSLALSPDERTLYVTNGGTNSVAVVSLGAEPAPSEVVGLIPTGWYPHSVSVSTDGRRLFVVNGKGLTGDVSGACRDTSSTDPAALNPCLARNLYVLQVEKSLLVSLPVPTGAALRRLTRQVATNNHFTDRQDDYERFVMDFLRSRIHHVIYIIKENRTYDQILGDLELGNGDPSQNIFPEVITPNHHALARNFVTLDAFQDSGEVSGVGWNWTTAARTTDIVEKTQFPNYAGRGVSYDWEGTDRNINTGLATVAERQAFNPATPADPDLMPEAIDYVAPEAPGDTSDAVYLWDAALNRGLSVRNYGCFGDLARYGLADTDPLFVPIVTNPAEQGIRQFFPTKPSLQDVTDLYFRGYDQKQADFYNYREWEREFDQYAMTGDLPALEFVRFPHDHFGEFGRARYRVNTPDKQMADNDYAIGLLVEKIANSTFAQDTLVFVIEDDAQNGPDHVDAHRSVGYVVGPYVRQGTVISRPYNTVSMVRTIEEVLGLEPMGLTDGFATPMTDVFEPLEHPRPWTYVALVPDILHDTDLPLPSSTPWNTVEVARSNPYPMHDAAYWERAMAGQNFSREDAVDEVLFNRALWQGMKGSDVPYPSFRDGRDLSQNRGLLLAN